MKHLGPSEERARRVFGARAPWYATSAVHADQEVLARVVAQARPRADVLALDIATGTGHTAFALAPQVRQVAAVDLTPEMLNEARKLQRANGIANVAFAVASAADLPFAAAAFDVVTCRRAAHHFSDLGRALAEAYRVLKPGGRLVVDDRSVPEDDFVDATMNRLDSLHDPSHVREYRASEWSAMFLSAGFRVAALETYIKHRPLSSLTEGVSPADAARVLEIVGALDEAQRAALQVSEEQGQIFTAHWYVMVVGVR